MKITNVHFERVYNIGNYQSERIGVDVALNEEGDSPEYAVQFAREFVHKSRPAACYNEPPPPPFASVPASTEEEEPRF